MTTKRLDQDLIDHACSQLGKAARKHVREGMAPASAASTAIRETKALFPIDWRLGVQGDDTADEVEVWEVEHKRSIPCARISREPETETPAKLSPVQRQHLDIIMTNGGRVRRSWLGGWLDGVKGLRLPVIEQLVRDGVLVTETAQTTRRTPRSKGMPSRISTYKIVEGTQPGRWW